MAPRDYHTLTLPTEKGTLTSFNTGDLLAYLMFSPASLRARGFELPEDTSDHFVIVVLDKEDDGFHYDSGMGHLRPFVNLMNNDVLIAEASFGSHGGFEAFNPAQDRDELLGEGGMQFGFVGTGSNLNFRLNQFDGAPRLGAVQILPNDDSVPATMSLWL